MTVVPTQLDLMGSSIRSALPKECVCVNCLLHFQDTRNCPCLAKNTPLEFCVGNFQMDYNVGVHDQLNQRVPIV
jgi:hypothetical protein